ncbi:MAG: hypothetical protein K9L64_00935 [Candidatus Izimaplasma sp.]|nr:hypothetical protein [Candidatus Izimaplasma bacterium]
MNNLEIKKLVTKQLSYDINCEVDKFYKVNTVVNNNLHQKRRFFYKEEPAFLRAININQNVIIACDKQIKSWSEKFVNDIPGYRFFDSIQLNALNNELKKYNQQVGMIGEYFLPNIDIIENIETNFKYEILMDKEIKKLYTDKRFPMALMYKDETKRKDNMAVVAYDLENNIMGVSGSTLDSDVLCSVGVDVIKKYRNKGIGLALTKIITKALLAEGFIPYLGASIGNIKSKKLAHNAGYYPFWIELETYSINKSNTFLKPEYQ